VRLDLGRVPEELVSVYFQAADAVVLPYRRSFLGTSGVLQRAVRAKKPIIATDAGEVGDLVRRHGLGLVVDPENPRQFADAIKQYVSKREVIEAEVATHAPLYISQNHWRQTGAFVLKAYQAVVSRADTRSAPISNR
jgi:glycosyltransferase involved in cell wall biosynthesis